jgi:hypothetical protein
MLDYSASRRNYANPKRVSRFGATSKIGIKVCCQYETKQIAGRVNSGRRLLVRARNESRHADSTELMSQGIPITRDLDARQASKPDSHLAKLSA